ncbi:hypothetical protein NQ318_021845 [Aromia moschata]|uniref:Secreted protein n=1 Tax=Aromia moschata TaxID=1265417 RepID=A0AAV8Z7Z6_9CUCU|nr:hypothetical protein NQ318_021845 [Aromia moschata]
MEFHIPVRFWIGCMVFLTTYINYTTRVNMSISIVSMTTGKNKAVPECKRENWRRTCVSPSGKFGKFSHVEGSGVERHYVGNKLNHLMRAPKCTTVSVGQVLETNGDDLIRHGHEAK